MSFQNSINAKKTQDSFYQQNTKVKPYIKSSYKNKFVGNGQQ